jgi:hypothetical protein
MLRTLKDDFQCRLIWHFEILEVCTVAIVLGLIGLAVFGKQMFEVFRKRLKLTQFWVINQKASPKHTIAAMNGLTFVPVAATRLSPRTPDMMATILFNVVMMPNMALKLMLLFSRCCA